MDLKRAIPPEPVVEVEASTAVDTGHVDGMDVLTAEEPELIVSSYKSSFGCVIDDLLYAW